MVYFIVMILVEKFVAQSATAALLLCETSVVNVRTRFGGGRGEANENLWLNKTL